MTLMEISLILERPQKCQRKLDWKTEWSMCNVYTRCNISMKRPVTMFEFIMTTVHNVAYARANVLCDTFAKFFPAPTRSKMPRAYPENVIKKFGQAHIYMILDATKIGAETASMKTANTIFYSTYRHGSTMKWLAACGHIGTVADPMIGTTLK